MRIEPKNLRLVQYLLNKEFHEFVDRKDIPKGYRTQFALLEEKLLGNEVVVYTDNSKTVITDNWDSFKIKYDYYGDMGESITMSVKKTPNTNSDTNVIINFVKHFVRPKKY